MSRITTNLEEAIFALKNNEIVAIPTETVYGLAGNALNEAAIAQIYALKKRPLTHPLILHVAQDMDLLQWVEAIPDYAKTFMHAFWPGPLTLVFRLKKNALSSMITAGQPTVAIRCPKHPISQALLQQLGFPLVAPSANPFGKISPTTAEHVALSFADKDLLILDGGRSTLGIESTIVTATDPDYFQVLRQGLIDETMLRQVVPDKLRIQETDIAVPGRLKEHYQPNKTLYHFDFGAIESALEFIREKNQPYYLLSFAHQNLKPHYQWPNHPEKLAYELYYQLRIADSTDAQFLITELPPDEKKWQGIRERLIKASVPL